MFRELRATVWLTLVMWAWIDPPTIGRWFAKIYLAFFEAVVKGTLG